MTNLQTEAVELTPKQCRLCGHYFVSPKGSRWMGCRTCYPTLDMQDIEHVIELDRRGHPLGFNITRFDLPAGYDEIPF